MNWASPLLRILWRKDLWDKPLRHILNEELPHLPRALRPPVTHHLYGMARHRRFLEQTLRDLCEHPPRDPRLSQLLLLGLHALYCSSGTPDHALVDGLVRLAPPPKRGFVNAIFRRAIRERQTRTSPELMADMPPLIERAIRQAYPDQETIQAHLVRPPRFHLLPHPRGFADMDTLLSHMEQHGLPHQRVPGMGILVSRLHPQLRSWLLEGKIYLQNPSSTLIATLIAEDKPRRVADLCAAPGGKSLSLLASAPDLAVVAMDVHEARCARLTRTLSGLSATVLCGDARRPPLIDDVDLVLVDAPCSSLGTLRKNPDLISGISRERIHDNAALQAEIMLGVHRSFPRATLFYTVCTFTPEETTEQSQAFTQQSGRRPLDLCPRILQHGFSCIQAGTGALLLPTAGLENDLFFLAAWAPLTV